MPTVSYKTFSILEGRRYINGHRVSKVSFDKRRLKECFHQWRPINCSERDGECRDCELKVVNGKKQIT